MDRRARLCLPVSPSRYRRERVGFEDSGSNEEKGLQLGIEAVDPLESTCFETRPPNDKVWG